MLLARAGVLNKDFTAGDFPFTVAELAAAATYLEQIPPGVPEDPF